MHKNFKQKCSVLLEAFRQASASTMQVWLIWLYSQPLNYVKQPYEHECQQQVWKIVADGIGNTIIIVVYLHTERFLIRYRVWVKPQNEDLKYKVKVQNHLCNPYPERLGQLECRLFDEYLFIGLLRVVHHNFKKTCGVVVGFPKCFEVGRDNEANKHKCSNQCH